MVPREVRTLCSFVRLANRGLGVQRLAVLANLPHGAFFPKVSYPNRNLFVELFAWEP